MCHTPDIDCRFQLYTVPYQVRNFTPPGGGGRAGGFFFQLADLPPRARNLLAHAHEAHTVARGRVHRALLCGFHFLFIVLSESRLPVAV